MKPAGFIIDVPVYLSVAVRGGELTKKQAIQIAKDYAESLQPSQEQTDGYVSVALAGTSNTITEVTLSKSESEPEVLDELDAEEDEEA
jgi:hypothetical protein